jgi:hypothetical protein
MAAHAKKWRFIRAEVIRPWTHSWQTSGHSQKSPTTTWILWQSSLLQLAGQNGRYVCAISTAVINDQSRTEETRLNQIATTAKPCPLA